MLYICIPVFDESPTVGLVLWRIRKMFQDYSREYEIVVYNDGSKDATQEILTSYADTMPLTILGSPERRGYAHALDALARAVTAGTRYGRRDAMILMQADFTDPPEHLPELIKRFEGGADIVVAERAPTPDAPKAVRRLSWLARWMARPLTQVPGVADPFATLRLYRISVLRDLLKALGSAPIAEEAGWAANAEMLLRLVPYARRIEAVSLARRYDLRPRESRIRPWPDAMELYRSSRRARALVPAEKS